MAKNQSTIPLGESSYDILSETGSSSLGEEIDTDDNLGSVASVDDHISDELESLTGTEISVDSRFTQSESDSEEAASAMPTYVGLDGGESGSNSGLTVVPGHRSASSSIEFNEEASASINYVAASHTIRKFSEPEAAKILNVKHGDSVPSRLTASLRQTMAKTGLAVDGSFRVLYVGDGAGKSKIVPKLGSALAASSTGLHESKVQYSSSRFSVVPISEFGSKRSPTVELIDSFGIELVVDECTSVTNIRVPDSSDTLMLQLNNSIWISSLPSELGHEFSIKPKDAWKLPHLAVFYTPENDNTEQQKLRHYAKAFLARHHIPSINICENPNYSMKNESIVLNSDSIHVCLESRNADSLSTKVHKRIPVDLATFLSLDSRQMNRNFAFLTRSTIKNKLTDSEASTKKPSHKIRWSTRLENCLGNSFGTCAPEKRALWLGSLLSLGLILLTVLGIYLKSSQYNYSTIGWNAHQTAPIPKFDNPPLTIAQHILSSTEKLKDGAGSKILSTALSKTSQSRALTGPIADIANMLSDPNSALVNHSDKFQLHLVGDSHMILKSPQRFSQLKKQPRVYVKALRGDTLLQTKLSKLFDGVWTIQLEREKAYGLVNISVWTKSKPVIREDFVKDFGTPWLKMANWRKAAFKLSSAIQEDLMNANEKLLTALGEVAIDSHGILAQASRRARAAGKIFQNNSLSKVFPSKELVLTSATKLKKQLKNGQEHLRTDVAVYSSDLAKGISRVSKQGYRKLKAFPVEELWSNLHLVKPRDIWPEARRHFQLLMGGKSYGRSQKQARCSKKSWKSCRAARH